MSVTEEFAMARRSVTRTRRRPVYLGAAADEWLSAAEREGTLSATTLERYRELLDLYLAPALGEKRLDQISRADVVALRMVLSSRMGASGLNQSRAVLSGAIRHARSTGYEGDDPMRWWESAKTAPKRRRDVLDPSQIESLCPLDGSIESIRDAALYRCMGFAGLRLSECRALLRENIDLDGKLLLVQDGYTDAGGDGPTKGRNVRSVPLAPQVEAALRTLLRAVEVAPHERVFQESYRNHEVLDENCVRRRLAAAAREVGIEHLTPHTLRHSAATLLAQVLPIHDVQAALGHKSLRTTALYLHSRPRGDEAKRLGELIERRSR